MAPPSCPHRWRSCARVTADIAGTAIASISPATARAMPISIKVIPRGGRISLLSGHRCAGRVAAVHADVVAAALRLVRAVRIDVIALAVADIAVLAAPRILMEILYIFRD